MTLSPRGGRRCVVFCVFALVRNADSSLPVEDHGNGTYDVLLTLKAQGEMKVAIAIHSVDPSRGAGEGPLESGGPWPWCDAACRSELLAAQQGRSLPPL